MISQDFAALTQQEQIARIELLGREALREFGVEPTGMTSLFHGENTTYKVESPQGDFCLRVCRPGYQSDSNILSEIEFLTALKHASFPVPEPYQDRVVKASVPEVPEARNCVLLRWQEGKFCREGYSIAQAAAVGKLMAELHNFSSQWVLPEGFDRQQLHGWAFDHVPQPALAVRQDSIDPEDFDLLVQVDQEARDLLNRLPRDAANFGLIHADLHQGNVLFDGDEIHVIDFDDLGYGFWLYDFSAALCFMVEEDEYPQVRDALLNGYSKVRPLPPGTEELLPAFIRLRAAGIANWILNRTDNPMFRERAREYVHGFCTSIRNA